MPYETMVREAKTLTYEQQFNLVAIFIEAMKAKMYNNTVSSVSEPKKDYRDSYPSGYFDLFGSIDDPTFVEPEDFS